MAVKNWLYKLTSNRTVATLFLLHQGVIYWLGGALTKQPWRTALALLAVAAGAALVTKRRWGIKFAMIVLAGVFAAKIGLMIYYGKLSLNPVIGAAMAAYFVWGLWKEPDVSIFSDSSADGHKPSPPPGADKPIISLVQLRSSQRYLEPVILANALSAAWGLNITGNKEPPEDADGFVTGSAQLYVAGITKPQPVWFMIYNFPASYFDDAEAVAQRVPNLRYAQIIRDHTAWFSVDLLPFKEGAISEEEAYRLIGKATAALADDGTQALLCPQHNYFNLWSAELETALCGEEPLRVFRQEVKAPVIPVKDTEIGDAIAEARRRWTEFAASFQKREPDDDRYLVKAPFTGEDGETEHMWLQVFGLEPEYVHGHLINEPFHCKHLKQGAQVEVEVSEISDWICPDAEGEPLGNFTHRAVRNSSKDEG